MISNVVVAGGGTLGSQIAFQTAYFGKNVTIYDISEEALANAKNRIAKLKDVYADYFGVTSEVVAKVADNIQYSDNLANAVQHADLVIEATPEVMAIKNDFYTKLMQVIPEETIIATNTSTMVPSAFENLIGEKNLYRFTTAHYANNVWEANTLEIMPSSGTKPETTNEVARFADDTGLIAIKIDKEQSGYLLNSLLVPWLDGALRLFGADVAQPEMIDKVWMTDLKSSIGPFGCIDKVGLRTVFNITEARFADTDDDVMKQALNKLQSMIDKNELGVETNKGFYTYPNPAYENLLN